MFTINKKNVKPKTLSKFQVKVVPDVIYLKNQLQTKKKKTKSKQKLH